jgi:hypothetical protein
MVSPPEGGDRDAVEVLGADRPLLRDRWRALPRRVRRTATAVTCAAVFAALLGYLAAHRPPPPLPHPAATTTVRITRVGLPVGLDQDFPVTLRAEAASRVTYWGMRDRYEGQFVFLSVVPVPGIELRPGRARALHTRFIVFCHGRRPPRGTPLLYVLVRNARGQESTPVVPTESQFDSLDRAVRKACAD